MANNQKPFLIDRERALMLKDYLNDDFSSCSSNGFKSFPRRQCCTTTTVRFLLEIDLNSSKQQRFFKRSKSSKTASSAISVLQRAFIRLLPFPASNSKSSSSSSSSSAASSLLSPSKLLPRSFSRKLFKKSFWRKVEHKQKDGGEITRWRSFHEFLRERDDKQSINQGSTSSSSASNSNSWSESEFSGNSESYSRRNVVVAGGGEKDLSSEKKVSYGVGVSVGEDSSITNTKEWANEDGKEQFSPVSVLDCPFQDEDETSSPFQRRLDRMEGAKKKLMAKIRSFESLAQLQPVNLEKQIEVAGLEDDEPIKFPLQACSVSIDAKEEQAQKLVKLVKATAIPSKSLLFKADGILLDFFREKILENSGIVENSKELKQELEVIQDWINGHPQEMFLGWEVKGNRHVYVNGMEKNGKWRNLDEEKQELVLELELEVFTSLVNEALLDLPLS